MCSIRHGQAQRAGKPGFYSVCPFAAKAVPAVPCQRIGLTVATTSSAVPPPKGETVGLARVLVPATARYFENPKRGPPFLLFHS
jgi:hypothetical protein